jgi:FixJ family two-component response regulator
MSSARLVHLIDDDGPVRDAVSLLLRVGGYEVRSYPSALAFLQAGEAAGCVVTDVQMPGMTGLELLERLRAAGRDLPVIVMTGRAERGMAEEAVSQGAAAFIHKPFGPDELLALVDRLHAAA